MQPVDLLTHPEGGKFREVFRSPMRVMTDDGRARSALTHIYFSLGSGEVSRFHRVSSDEVWNLYRGDGIRIHTWAGPGASPVCTELSPQANAFCHVVAAGEWQAAEPIGDAVLVGCSVGPGFEFEDFEMINPASADAEAIRADDPALVRFILP